MAVQVNPSGPGQALPGFAEPLDRRELMELVFYLDTGRIASDYEQKITELTGK
jgi:hypothetical protein